VLVEKTRDPRSRAAARESVALPAPRYAPTGGATTRQSACVEGREELGVRIPGLRQM
jgi:hypothetical protein